MIQLFSGNYNPYLALLKEKAYLNKYISFMEYIEPEVDDELKEKLVKWYPNL